MVTLKYLSHGSAWKNHKYIRKEGNRYIYAEDLQKAKNVKSQVDTPQALLTLKDSQNSTGNSNSFAQMVAEAKTSKSSTKKSKSEKSSSKKSSSKKGYSLDDMAKKVIRGEFGNGADRQKKLGSSYKEIQKRVNEILLGKKKASTINVSNGKKKVASKSKILKAKVKSVL